jgi:FimV-like protein
MTFHLRRYWLIAFFFTVSSFSWGIGMGDIHSTSYLGQPLKARIPLYQIGDFSAEQLKIALASAEEHQRFGVEPLYQLRNIRMNIVVQGDRSYVELTSREPIVEPYLDFVLTLRWSDGALAKNFTVFLDPVSVAEKDISGNSAATIVSSEKNNTEIAEKNQHHSAGKPRVSTTGHAGKIVDTKGEYVIQPGDSLWVIAGRYKPEGVSREAMMSAIHRANGHAFINGNAEKLKAIATIKIPAGAELAALIQDGKIHAVGVAESAEKTVSSETKVAHTAIPEVKEPKAVITDTVKTNLPDTERAQYQHEIANLTSRVETLTTELTHTHEKMAVLQTQMQGLIDQYQHLSAKEQAAHREMAQYTTSDSAINTLEASSINHSPSVPTSLWVHASYLLAIFVLGCWVIWDHWQFVERRLLAKLTSHPSSPAVRREQANLYNPFPVTRVSDRKEKQKDEEFKTHEAAADWSHIQKIDVLPSVGEDQRDPLLTASAYAAFGRYEEAEEILSQAISEMPERGDLYLELLQVYIRSGNIDKMIKMQEDIAEKFAHDDDVQKELRRLS